MKKSLLAAVLVMAEVGFATPVVSGVTAKQRYPWNGLVDITVTLSGTEEECAAATFPFYATNRTTRAELLVRNVKPAGAVAGAGNTWTRRFVWNATADVGCAKFGEVELTIGIPSIGVQLWENGPYWAECNVGASNPTECGYYFWWGDTIGYERNSANNGWVSVKDGSSFSFGSDDNCPTYRKDNSQLQVEGYIDSEGNLMPAHDAATAYIGAPWRMPTSDEIKALVDNCTATWTNNWNGTGVNGRLVTGNGAYASKSIFLPATGYGERSYLAGIVFGPDGDYWSSTPDLGYDFIAAGRLYFTSKGFYESILDRYYGLPVRPVRGVSK